ncbi:similar to Saccharomyces cerevisiae YKL171W NNK1 Protein kinase [Maudiozyma saulgeensis]|uniref:Similar to Saccharomyces cerevisiae YKL171W NNK1 Protein kinase n=1 Tax=Maudiozyma saulgeensis TaxID=1789683 RepID=A0A1X7R173_9SACH|nr:similar to Saccharomyces cerevisiae YKL171W NNK1 Protein kinase [Kazachstania saulgeensis]
MDSFSRVYKQRNKSNRSIRSSDSRHSRSSSRKRLSPNKIKNDSCNNFDLVDKETNFNPYSLTERLINNYTLTSFNQPHSSNLTETSLVNSLHLKETSPKTTPSANNNDDDNEEEEVNSSSSYLYSDLAITKPTTQEYTSGKYLLGDDFEDNENERISVSQVPSTEQSSSYNLVLSAPPLRRNNQQDNSNDDFLEIQGEYIPGLNYIDILDKWQKQDQSDNDYRKQVQNTRFGSTTGSNSNSYKNSSYSSLFKKMHKQNKNSSLALTKFPTWESADEDNEINSYTNNDAYGFDSAAAKSTGITIPVDSNTNIYRSNHAKVEPIPLPSLRTLMTPPSELEMKRRISYPLMFSNNNNDITTNNNNNNNSLIESPQLTNRLPFSSLKLRTLPSSSALTNQLSSLRRRGSLQLPGQQLPQHRASIDQSSVSSSLTNIPRSFDNVPSLKRETIMEIIDLLPDDFISQPYSQRKKMILKLLPPEQIDNYKVIMSLIKKRMLSSSRSNISLVNSNVPNNSSNGDNNGISQTNDAPIDCSNNNYGTSHQTHHHVRHNSIASQYLSTFSPSFVSSSNFMPGEGTPYDTHLGNCVSTTTLPVKPEEKGGQIFNHTMGKIIGFGAWGTIRECINNATGQSRAIKIVRFKNNDKMKNQVEREVSNWKKLNHPYILPLLESKIDDEGTMYSLTKKIDDGTLYDLVISWDAITNTKIPCKKRCRYTVDLAREVIDALQYMHSLNIVHGDVKLENCLLEDSKSEKHRWNLYVCDFGMSHDILHDNPNKGNSSPSNIGSLPYASPELLTDNSISYKSDVWAFGVMLYTMLLGKLPFKHGSESKLRELIKSGHFDIEALHFLDNYEHYKPLKDIICGCLEVDLSKRWDLSKIGSILKDL